MDVVTLYSTQFNQSSVCSMSSQSSGISETSSGSSNLHNRDFKIILDVKTGAQSQVVVHLVAPNLQEKAAWISDISQCMDNVHFNDLLHSSMSDTSSVTMPQSIKNDPKLFKDDVDIRFSRTLNSCKVPQIRYATPERLLERLTDLRFLSIDFLNTFLLTYRVFTDGVTVLEALKRVFYNADPPEAQTSTDGSIISSVSPRRTSGASSVSGYGSEMSDRDRDRSHSYDSQAFSSKGHWRCSYRKFEEDQRELGLIKEGPPIIRQSPTHAPPASATPRKSVSIRVQAEDDGRHLTIPRTIAVSSSAETLTDNTVLSAPSSPSNLSTVTLVGSNNSDPSPQGSDATVVPESDSQQPEGVSNEDTPKGETGQFTYEDQQPELTQETASAPAPPEPKPTAQPKGQAKAKTQDYHATTYDSSHRPSKSSQGSWSEAAHDDHGNEALPERIMASSSRSASITTGVIQTYYTGRRSMQEDGGGGSVSQRTSFQHDSPQNSSKAGVVITSFRQSQRRSSTSTAAAAFAIATSASSNPRDVASPAPKAAPGAGGRCSVGDASLRSGSCRERNRRKESVMSTAATMRVLNVLRHWVSKHAQDFELDQRLKNLTIEFLEDIIYSPNLLPAEHKAASQLLRLITKEEPESNKVDLDLLLAPPMTPSKENIETLSALEIAEQMTYVSQLVVSEIVRRSNMAARISVIEKWAAVADISRCLHNFNGVLQVCAAFTNSAVFRLKKTWEKVSKTTKQTIEKLQNIIAHVIREIRHFQQTPYKIELIQKVTNYLLDPSLLLDDDELYRMSLEIEPRTSRLSSSALAQLPLSSQSSSRS
ncbi:Ras-specific guanine nucleotide-releasing factor 2 [Gryllus bimaculatus]|nr:Ras-specific guanine nucleotide-releasing factor 2 [Gryllus bimaculatus]